MKKIIYPIIFVLIHISMGSLAQKPSSPTNLQSPNVASLGLYGEVPISHYTGTPSIEIPLYTINARDFNLPISLRYHSSGVRPDQHPGWVGLGWNLNSGGAIYRIVNDMPDDYNNPNYHMGDKIGYYFNYGVLNTTQWNQRTYLRQIAQSDEMLKDTAPDEFSFSFPGYTGKFYRTQDGIWDVQCSKPLKVIFDNSFINIPFDKSGTRAQSHGYSPSFSGFTLIGEDGTQYIFGGNRESIEYSIGFFSQPVDDWVASAWHLTKIITPNFDEISFSYERGDFINQMYISVQDDLGSYTEAKGGIFNPQPECSSWSQSSVHSSYQGKLLAAVYLKKIVFFNGYINFNREISNELKFPESAYSWKYSQWSQYGREYPFLPILKSSQQGYPNCLSDM